MPLSTLGGATLSTLADAPLLPLGESATVDPGIVVLLGQGQLTIDGIEMCRAAWCVLDLSSLWGFPDFRGQNLVIPQAAGRRAYRRYIEETTYQLRMQITGAVDETDTPHVDPVMGLALNLEYLWDNVVTPDTGATRAAVLTMPDGSTRTADVQIQIVLGDLDGAYDKSAVLHVTVPAGRFEESGS